MLCVFGGDDFPLFEDREVEFTDGELEGGLVSSRENVDAVVVGLGEGGVDDALADSTCCGWSIDTAAVRA